jgi:hypothetical protein
VARTIPAARYAVRPNPAPVRVDSLQLSGSVVPMSGAPMRILEATIAFAALATAALLAFIH